MTALPTGGGPATYTGTVFLNLAREACFGYEAQHPVATASDLTFTLLDSSESPVIAVAEQLWSIGNRVGVDIRKHGWPSDVRSMCVGDVVRVHNADGTWWLSVERSGWQIIQEPRNRTVALEGSMATSRVLA